MCVSADYRLSPRATFPDHLVDLKRALALDPRARRRVRRRPRLPRRHRRLGRRAPGGAGRRSPPTTPSTSPASSTSTRRCRAASRSTASTTSPTATASGGTPACTRLLERRVMKAARDEAREAYEQASPMSRVRPRRAALLRHPRRPRHAGAGRRRRAASAARSGAGRPGAASSTRRSPARSTPSRSSRRCAAFRHPGRRAFPRLGLQPVRRLAARRDPIAQRGGVRPGHSGPISFQKNHTAQIAAPTSSRTPRFTALERDGARKGILRDGAEAMICSSSTATIRH